VDDAGLEPGGDGGALDRGVVVAGALDGDDEVAEVVIGHGLANAGREVGERLAGMLDRRRVDEDVAIEIGEHPFGPGLDTIDGDDAEVLGANLLDHGVDGTRGLGDRDRAPMPACGPAGRDGHTDTSGFVGRGIPNPLDSPNAPERRFLSQLERVTVALRTCGAPSPRPSPRWGEGDRFPPPPRLSRPAEAPTVPFSPAGRRCPKGG
jgi:hypothetical protein